MGAMLRLAVLRSLDSLGDQTNLLMAHEIVINQSWFSGRDTLVTADGRYNLATVCSGGLRSSDCECRPLFG